MNKINRAKLRYQAEMSTRRMTSAIEVINISSESSEEDDNWSWIEDMVLTGDDPPSSSTTQVSCSITNPSSSVPISCDSSSLGILATFEKTECAFCGEGLDPGEGVVLDKCLHSFCKSCIIAAIEVTDDAAKTDCPVAEESGCGGLLLDREVKALITPDAYKKYLKRSLEMAMRNLNDFVECLDPNCLGLFTLNKDGNDLQHFKCVQCHKINCLVCKQIRDEVGLCGCSQFSADGQPISKQAKIDPEVKRDWEEKWKQAQETFKSQQEQIELSPQPGCSYWDNNNTNSSGNMEKLLYQMESNHLLRNTKAFECSICFCDIDAGDGIILMECFHMFCKDCLVSTFKHCEEINVKCPHQMNEYMCSSLITNREIKALLTEEEHDKFVKRSETQAEMSMSNTFHCKSVNCPSWCEIEGNAEYLENFYCPVCNRRNCLKCKAIHEAVSCAEYQQQLQEDEMDTKTKKMIQKNIKSGLAMKCPTCKVIIEKVSGCDAVTCQMCKTQICWATKGPRWGPKGQGDMTGGCHCNENGILCHKKCGNCH